MESSYPRIPFRNLLPFQSSRNKRYGSVDAHVIQKQKLFSMADFLGTKHNAHKYLTGIACPIHSCFATSTTVIITIPEGLSNERIVPGEDQLQGP